MNKNCIIYILGIVLLIAVTSCKNPSSNKGTTPSAPTLFTLLPPEQTNIHFRNDLTEGINTNVLLYEYFYNGGGVAVGDVIK